LSIYIYTTILPSHNVSPLLAK